MDENKFYTKGDKSTVIKRLNQVHAMILYCPLSDEGMEMLKTNFEIMLPGYRTDDTLWSDVPAIEALNVFMMTITMAREVSMNVVLSASSVLKMFNRLKYIDFQFTNDPEIMETYTNAILKNVKGMKKVVYKVKMLEMNLNDMFSQEVIDVFNKVLMMNEIVSNSYLKRKFVIDFTYDEYISFMDMFLGHNGPALHRMDENICEYFRSFPIMVNEQKPGIRIVTNYKEL